MATALRKGPYQINLVLAGYDGSAETGNSSVYFIDMYASCVKLNFAAQVGAIIIIMFNYNIIITNIATLFKIVCDMLSVGMFCLILRSPQYDLGFNIL